MIRRKISPSVGMNLPDVGNVLRILLSRLRDLIVSVNYRRMKRYRSRNDSSLRKRKVVYPHFKRNLQRFRINRRNGDNAVIKTGRLRLCGMNVNPKTLHRAVLHVRLTHKIKQRIRPPPGRSSHTVPLAVLQAVPTRTFDAFYVSDSICLYPVCREKNSSCETSYPFAAQFERRNLNFHPFKINTVGDCENLHTFIFVASKPYFEFIRSFKLKRILRTLMLHSCGRSYKHTATLFFAERRSKPLYPIFALSGISRASPLQKRQRFPGILRSSRHVLAWFQKRQIVDERLTTARTRHADSDCRNVCRAHFLRPLFKRHHPASDTERLQYSACLKSSERPDSGTCHRQRQRISAKIKIYDINDQSVESAPVAHGGAHHK